MHRSVLALSLSLAGIAGAQDNPFGAPRAIRGSRVFPAAAATADINLDGRKDIIVGNAFSIDLSGPMSAYILDASYKVKRSFALERTKEPGLMSHTVIGTGDFTGDLLPDMFAISDKGYASIHVHQGSTPLSTSKRFVARDKLRRIRLMIDVRNDLAQFRGYGLVIDDFTGDGNADVAFCGEARLFFESLGQSGISMLVGDGKGGFATETNIQVGAYIGLAKADLDADGRPDLVGLQPKASVTIALGGSRGWRKTQFRIAVPSHPSRLAVGDVNNDGRDDILLAGKNESGPQIAGYLTNSLGAPGKLIQIDDTLAQDAQIESIVAEDFNRDGNVDMTVLVVPAGQSNSAFLVHYRGDGTGRFKAVANIRLGARISRNATPAYVNYLVASDLNGDDNPELLVGSSRDLATETLVQWVIPNVTKRRHGYRRIGHATKGSGGHEPLISCAGGRAVLGNARFSLLLADALGSKARAALIMGPRLEPRDFFGLDIYTFPLYSFGVRTAGPGPGGGTAAVTLPIPDLPGIANRPLYFQWLIADRMAKNVLGVAATRAFEVRIAPK